jgi:hypothetical protein
MSAPPYGQSFLRVMFPAPGFFIGDTEVTVLVDGYLVLQASFVQGFDWWAEVGPGWHVVETRILTPIGIERKRTYRLEVRPGLVTVAVLEYSRMWGNLTDSPKSVSFVPR